MIYILITIAGFISIISTAIFKSIAKDSKYKILYRVLVIVISAIVYFALCAYLVNQKVVE
jgi:hypothetical protein